MGGWEGGFKEKWAKCRGRVGVGRLAVYSGGRKGQFRGKDCLSDNGRGRMAGRQWHLDGGWVAMFIIGGLIAPHSLGGGGMHLERDVRGFHFRWKWKPVRWSWGTGGYGVNSLTNSGHRFWSLGGSIFGGEGDGREVSQAD